MRSENFIKNYCTFRKASCNTALAREVKWEDHLC